jgi:proton-dependent oligopeptide transporter, POT family
MSTPTTTRNDRWPPQIKFIVGNEAAERFSYYGMKSILALYITQGLLQSKDQATTIIHLFGFANYFMPLFGAWLSDRFWGRYRTILWISLSYCAGHGVLATSDLFTTVNAKLICLYSGLGLIAFGAGGIKPCVSAFMGDQFGADQGHLMRKAYGAFYFSINFGSFFSFLIIPWIAAKHTPLTADAGFVDRLLWQIKDGGFSGYGWAFGVPGIVMALATFIFWLGTRHYVRKPPARETRTAGFFAVFLTAFRNLPRGQYALNASAVISLLTTVVLPLLMMIGMVYVAVQHQVTPAVKTVGWVAVGCFGFWYLLVVGASVLNWSELPDAFWKGARARFNATEIGAARSLAPILAVLALVPAFWALFEQSNSTWVLQGAQMQPFNFLGLRVGAEQMQSLNPLLVMILVPLLNWGLYPFIESRGLRVTALRRMSFGLLLTALSYVFVAWLQYRLETKDTLSLAWQALPYLILTTAEVLVSTTGLEFAYTQAAPSMKSTIMSFWLLTVAIGNLLVTTITQLGGGHGDESVSSGRFLLYAGMTGVVAVLFILIATRYRYRDAASQSVLPVSEKPA